MDTEIHDKTFLEAQAGSAIGATGGVLMEVTIATGLSLAIHGLEFVAGGTILAVFQVLVMTKTNVVTIA